MLQSGEPVSGEIADSILRVPRQGEILYLEFVEKRIQLETLPFYDPIKKNSVKFFNDAFSRQESSKKQAVLI